MKVLLAAYQNNLTTVSEHIGLGYLSSYLTQHGVEVQVIHGDAKRILHEVEKNNPDLVGFSTYDIIIQDILDVCARIKDLDASTVILLGGYTATYNAKYLLKNYAQIDFIIQGEGEIAIQELVGLLADHGTDYSGVGSLVYRDPTSGKILSNKMKMVEQLDSLPWPSRDVLIERNMKIAGIQGTRGCLSNCSFCVSPVFWKDSKGCKWKARSISNIVDEIEYIYNQHGISQFMFNDNSFEDGPRGRCMELANEIIHRNLHIEYGIDMRCSFHEKLSNEDLTTLKKSGLNNVFLGIESFVESDLLLYNKRTSVETNKKAVSVLRDCDINIDIGFININPYSTIEKIKTNFYYLHKYCFPSIDHYINRAVLYRGTPLYERVRSDGLMKPNNGFLSDYNYVDKKIECLSNYIDYFLLCEKKKKVSALTEYYTHMFPVALTHFEFIALRNGDNISKDNIAKAKSVLLEKKQIYNDIVFHMFAEIIQQIENGITDHALIDEKIAAYLIEIEQTMSILEKNKLSLVHRLAKQKDIYY